MLALPAVSLLMPTGALASPPDAIHPGRQSDPPGPPSPTPAPLAANETKRGHVRGCPLDAPCRDMDMAGLRAFELETFAGKRPGSPWLDDDDPRGHDSARRGRPGKSAPRPDGARKRPTKGTDIRPDLPWLDELRLPDIPVRWDERVIKYLEFYKDDPRGRNIMRGWLRRQGRYRDMILEHLRAAKLPDALLYISMIESSYDPHTYSRVGASGLWQFMPEGGRIYGLQIDRWIDERNDPVRSTEAAMLYFADLYQRFGDWHLALAAFNAGYGAVLWGVATYNTNDFWALLDYENALPFESTIYVPKFLATAIVGENLEFFGFADIDRLAPEEWDYVTVPKSTSLAAIARAAGVTEDAVTGLNPQLRRKRTPPRLTDYVVRIPEGKAPLFAERFAQLRSDWDDYDAYVVAHGERFEDIATVHGISRHKLARLNGIEHESEVRGGMVLVVPAVSKAKKQANREKADKDLYTAGSPRSEPEDKLLVPLPDKDLEVRGKKPVFYRVVTGDTQYRVAKAFQVSRIDLAAWNGLELDAHLHPRMVLRVFVPKNFRPEARGVKLLDRDKLWLVERGSSEHVTEVERRRGRERFIYKATKRESFEQIGRKYGLTARDLARVNRRSHTTVLEPGEEIVVYKLADADRSKRAALQARKLREFQRNRKSKASKSSSRKSGKKSGK